MPATVAGIHLGPDTHANRPAANAAGLPVGSLYSCSDHGLIYQSDGASWTTWATLGGGAVAADDVSIADAGGYFTGTDVEAALQELGAGGAGGGGFGTDPQLAIDAPPASANAMDDEFDDESLDTTTLWTVMGGATQATWTERADGLLYGSFAGNAGWNLQALTQPVAAGDFDFRLALAIVPPVGVSSHRIGLGLIEGTTAQRVRFLCFRWDGSYEMVNLTSFTGFGSSSVGVGARLAMPLYLRVTRTTTTLAWQVSTDGYTWHVLVSEAEPWTPTKVGIVVNAESTTGLGAAWKWFRRYA